MLEGILALQPGLKNISHLRHLREAAMGSVVGYHWNWNQCFRIRSTDLSPECPKVVIEVF
jgi:hypothetical protein